MYGKIMNTLLNVIFITYMLLLVSFYFLHEGIKENISTINTDTIEAVSISGTFSIDLYNNLKEQIIQYGGHDCDYRVTIKYQKKMSSGTYDTVWLKDTICVTNPGYPTVEEIRKKVDPGRIISVPDHIRPMYKGDKITIYLEDMNETLYGKLINMPFMGMLSDSIDFRIKSLKSTIVGRDAKNLVNGYEVIQEINKTDRNYKIRLITEQSDVDGAPIDEREYLFNPGSYYDETIAKFKYNYSTGIVGKYHIFSNNQYARVWDDLGATNIDVPDNVLGTNDTVYFYQTIK